MFGPDSSAAPPTSYGLDAQRNTRYVYLVARLRNRQMTMEEATELFGLMQAMLRASESARLVAARSVTVPSAAASESKAAPRPAAAPALSGSDDFLLMGLLAMGAGAGLWAAMAKRMGEAVPLAPPPAAPSRRANSTSTRS